MKSRRPPPSYQENYSHTSWYHRQEQPTRLKSCHFSLCHPWHFVCRFGSSLGEFVRREHVSLWGLVFPPNSPWLKKLLYENEYILTLFFHQVQSLENTQQKMKSRQCIFVIYWHKRVPRESSLGEQVECCSWVFKQGQCYYDWNPTSNVWDRNLWQRAIFSIKKQTLVPLIG